MTDRPRSTLTRVYGCPVEVPIAVIGGRWKPIILWHMLETPRRNGELLRLMPRISQKMLTQQLRELEADGLVARTVHDQVPPKVVYTLTDDGRTLERILRALCDWGHYWARRTHAEIGPIPSGVHTT
jgi:DNA-binding HxlR family transcriptional regulator